jgi:methylmalonyl-CoA/ethylmalonyl-CoA epimerase
MGMPNLASAFCQICWVVKDIEAAEKFFIETIGIKKFVHFDRIDARETEGTYLGKPGNWVCKLYIAYAGDTQIELVQPLSGESMFEESLKRHGNAVQHVAYWLDDTDYEEAARHLESAGYPLIQGFKFPILRVGYFDTRHVIGVVTELIGATEDGHKFRRDLKDENF